MCKHQLWEGKNSIVMCKHQLWEGKRSQSSQRKKKSQRIKHWWRGRSKKRVTCYKAWVTYDHESVNHPVVACRCGRQYTLLTGPSSVQKGRYRRGKGWPRPGALGKAKTLSFLAVVLPPTWCRRPQATVILDFEGEGGGDHEPIWGHVLSQVWSTFWRVALVRVRRNGGEISHFRHAETTSFHRQNRFDPEVRKFSKTIPRLNCV